MKLTTEQRSEIISEMDSSEAGFNELMRVLLDSFSNRIGHTCVLEQKKMSEISSSDGISLKVSLETNKD
jgi:hypothetical protein